MVKTVRGQRTWLKGKTPLGCYGKKAGKQKKIRVEEKEKKEGEVMQIKSESGKTCKTKRGLAP